MNNQGYLSRAWNDLTQDPKWWQPILILALVSLIPIVGGLILTGYMIDWAREAAWGMDRGFTRKVGDAGKRLKWGFFAAVIAICWVFPISIIGSMFAVIPVVGWIIAIAANVLVLIAGVIAMAASIRMSIYDRFGAGMQFSRMINMAKHDAGGLARCFCITLLQIVPIVIATVVVFIAFAPLLMGLNFSDMDVYSPAATMGVTSAIVGGGAFAVIVTLIIAFITMIAVTACQALSYRAFGYWTAQFQPEKWNGMGDPMPFEPGYVERGFSTASNPAQEPEGAKAPENFAETKEQAAAAAGAVGAAAAAAANKAVDTASEIAQGFRTEKVDPEAEDADEPAVVEAEVVAVEDEPAAPAAADDDVATSCPNCGAPVTATQKFCTNCGTKLQ